MSIYLFTSYVGHPIEHDQSHLEAFQAMADSPDVRITELHAGTHDITPENGSEWSYTHDVYVKDNGTATHYVRPRHAGLVAALVDHRSGETSLIAGETTIRLPEDQEVSLIIGRQQQSPRIFRALLYGFKIDIAAY